MTALLRIAVGPFSFRDGDEWPIYGHDELRDDGFEIVPFLKHSPPIGVHAVVWWSPEYHDPAPLFEMSRSKSLLPMLTVAFVGDWHVVPFGRIPNLAAFDLVATDWRGYRQQVHDDPARATSWLHFRGFSFDPRLHMACAPGCPETTLRELDVAFMGRRDHGPRDAFLQRVREICDRRGWRHHIQTTSDTPFARGEETKVYQKSEIVINLAQRGELNMRAYEAAACGALSVLQHDADEVFVAGAPLPTYAPIHVEAFLEAWLSDSARRRAMVQRQHEWVQQQRPVDHLRWLCRRIRERLETARTGEDDDDLVRREIHRHWGGKERADGMVELDAVSRASDCDTPAGDARRGGTLGAGAATVVALDNGPPLSEQRLDCVALVPPTTKRVLDVGCGAGGFAWALKRALPGVIVDGIERDREAFGATHGRLNSHWWMDVEAPEWPAPNQFSPGAYDCITCLDVLEHLRDPWRTLTQLRPLLTREGCLVASLPNIRNAASLFLLVVGGEWRYFRHGTMAFRGPQDSVLSWEHLRFFTHDSIDALFRECGYRIVRWEATRYTPPPADTAQERWRDELAYLVALHGGDADAFKRDALTLQHLVVARPDWRAAPLLP